MAKEDAGSETAETVNVGRVSEREEGLLFAAKWERRGREEGPATGESSAACESAESCASLSCVVFVFVCMYRESENETSERSANVRD